MPAQAPRPAQRTQRQPLDLWPGARRVAQGLRRPGFGLGEAFDAFSGRADKAFEWLNRAYGVDPGITEMKADPLLKNIRGDSRFRALLDKMKLPH